MDKFGRFVSNILFIVKIHLSLSHALLFVALLAIVHRFIVARLAIFV